MARRFERNAARLESKARQVEVRRRLGTTLATLAADIEGYSHTKSALHFGAGTPLPTTLVRKLLAARIAEGKRRRG
jgi:hypothetical protein